MDARIQSSASLVGLLALFGCTNVDGARDEFAKDYSCPADRVEARERPDLKHSSFDTSPSSQAQPPADVAADPDRLAMWRKSHRTDDGTRYDFLDIEEARGCGKQAFYYCHHQREWISVMCSREQSVPPSISHW